MMTDILGHQTEQFRRGRSLSPGDAEPILDQLISSSDEDVLRDVFLAWNEKGIDEDEIYELARIMRDRCIPVETSRKHFVDIVGTGGSRKKTFNVSTASAFVVAGAGVAVAKHGNRAATSNSGSADVLSELGIQPSVDAKTAARCLEEIGICFMFAPNFHRLSPTLAKVRRGLGFPTIFNCVGPLCNPANAPYQLIGVWDKELVPKMANALARLGTTKSWIVHGGDGLDEISLGASTFVAEIENGVVTEFEIRPGDFKVPPDQNLDGLRITGAAESAEIIREILRVDAVSQPAENVVLINAAAAIYLTGGASTLDEAHAAAFQSVSSGRAMAKLCELEEATKK